jgi:hypothetical protein
VRRAQPKLLQVRLARRVQPRGEALLVHLRPRAIELPRHGGAEGRRCGVQAAPLGGGGGGGGWLAVEAMVWTGAVGVGERRTHLERDGSRVMAAHGARDYAAARASDRWLRG